MDSLFHKSSIADETGIVILAAGSSSRLGQPKQLLSFEGKTLIRHITETALELTPTVVVVTGASSKSIHEEVKDLAVQVEYNAEHKEGIASSIRCGLSALLAAKTQVENVLLVVCDQPYISVDLLKQLVLKRRETKKEIVACSYNNTIGTPALFGKTFFEDLLHLRGDSGAKKIMQQHQNKLALVPFPMGYFDIDTPDDYTALMK